MNKRNIHILNSIIIFSLVFVVLGCGNRSGNNAAASSGQEGANAQYQDSSDGAMQDDMIETVDIAGRTVTVPTGDVKVVLGGSFMSHTLALLFGKNGNPFTPIVGWGNTYDPDTYEVYVEKFPEISTIPDVGYIPKNFDIEKVISLNPDIIIMNLYQLVHAKEMKIIEKLDKIGIKTIFIDFGKDIKKIKQNTIMSMLLLGQIFGKTAEASAFANFYFAQMQKVFLVVSAIQKDKKPLVFMEYGYSIRQKVGEYRIARYGAWGSLVDLAGGRNYGAEIFESQSNVVIVSAEQLFTIEPDIIIGTGVNLPRLTKPQSTKTVLLGYKALNRNNKERLQEIISDRPGWETLKAVKNKYVYAIYHRFVNTPYHFIAVQQMAKWFYPDKFVDLDFEKTFKEFHDDFLPIEHGVFWAGLE